MFGRANCVISPLLDESPPAMAPIPMMMVVTIAVVAVVPMAIVAIVPAVVVGLLHIRILGRSLHIAEVYSGRRVRWDPCNA